MEYYYAKKENINHGKKEIVVDDFEFKHLAKVLRKRAGDRITLTDGERNIYQCEISYIQKEKLICKIIGHDFNLYEPEINVKLFISPLRNLSRFEFAIEKAVELGVVSIQPVFTEHTVSKNNFSNSRMERLRKIIIGAMGQSQRCVLPSFHNIINFDEMLVETKNDTNKIVMYESSDDAEKIDLNKNSTDVSLLIGPEGGFSEPEISTLQKNKWLVKSLGERKLRAETAAIVSIFNVISNSINLNK